MVKHTLTTRLPRTANQTDDVFKPIEELGLKTRLVDVSWMKHQRHLVNYRFLTTPLPWMAKKTHNFLMQTKNWLGSCTRTDTNRHVVNYSFMWRKAVVACAFFLLCAVPVFPQVVISGKVQANTGWLRLTDSIGTPPVVGTHDLWTATGYVQLNLETEGSQTIKGYVSGSYLVNTPDMEKFSKTGKTMDVAQTAALDRAYVKIRLPWFEGRKMRLNIGKMPVSWGYGMMYNAGDIIFGALPDSNDGSQSGGLVVTENSLSEQRAAADWFVHASLPLFSGVTLEPLVRLPLSLEELQGTNKPKNTPSFGGRVLWTPYWQALESTEAGYLASRDGKTHYAYAGLDGNLYVDYNFCSQVRINTSSQTSQWVVSVALAKTYIITNYDTGYEMPLSIRLESLWIPTQNNHSIMFAFVSAQVTDVLGLALNWTGTVHNGEKKSSAKAHLLSAGVTLIPIHGLEFTLSSVIDVENPSNMAGIAVGATYRF